MVAMDESDERMEIYQQLEKLKDLNMSFKDFEASTQHLKGMMVQISDTIEGYLSTIKPFIDEFQPLGQQRVYISKEVEKTNIALNYSIKLNEHQNNLSKEELDLKTLMKASKDLKDMNDFFTQNKCNTKKIIIGELMYKCDSTLLEMFKKTINMLVSKVDFLIILNKAKLQIIPKSSNRLTMFANNDDSLKDLGILVNAIPRSVFELIDFTSKSFIEIFMTLQNRFKSTEELLTWNMFLSPDMNTDDTSIHLKRPKRSTKSVKYQFFMKYDDMLPEIKDFFFHMSIGNQFINIFHWILTYFNNKEVQEKVSLSFNLKLFSTLTEYTKTILSSIVLINIDAFVNIHQLMAILYYIYQLRNINSFIQYSKKNYFNCMDEIQNMIVEKTMIHIKSVPNLIKSNKDPIQSDSSVQEFVINTVKLLEEFSKYNTEIFYMMYNGIKNQQTSSKEFLENLRDFITSNTNCLLQNLLNKVNIANDSLTCKSFFMFNNIIYIKNTMNMFPFFVSNQIKIETLVNIDEQLNNVFSKYDEVWNELSDCIQQSASLFKKDSTKVKGIFNDYFSKLSDIEKAHEKHKSVYETITDRLYQRYSQLCKSHFDYLKGIQQQSGKLIKNPKSEDDLEFILQQIFYKK